MDASAYCLDYAARRARDLGLTVTFGDGLMTELTYADASFDYVLSFNVIYHGDAGVVGRAVAEIYRVLKPGGLFHGTLLRSEEHTSELQSLMRISYAVFCLTKKIYQTTVLNSMNILSYEYNGSYQRNKGKYINE